jgi:hypothetical protein
MATRVLIKNVQPATRIAEGVARTIEVKETGGGPPTEHQIAPGQETEITVSGGRKITLSELGGEDE